MWSVLSTLFLLRFMWTFNKFNNVLLLFFPAIVLATTEYSMPYLRLAVTTKTVLPLSAPTVALNSQQVPRQFLMAGALMVLFFWFEKYLVGGLHLWSGALLIRKARASPGASCSRYAERDRGARGCGQDHAGEFARTLLRRARRTNHRGRHRHPRPGGRLSARFPGRRTRDCR